MSCRIERYLTAYVDGELSERLRRRVERHVARCPSCASELDSIGAFDRILQKAAPPAVSDRGWERFRHGLDAGLDGVDREAVRSRRVSEARPVGRRNLGRALAFAGACAVIAIVAFTAGPAFFSRGGGSGGVCVVESIETFASGYTPMSFTSKDPEMTVIWVFSEEVEPGIVGQGPGAR